MARQTRKSGYSTGPVVTPLEHHVPVEWAVVGTPEWIEGAWEEGALDGIETWYIDPNDPLPDLQPIHDYLWTLRVLYADSETTGPYKPGDRNYSMNPQNPDTRVVLLQIGNEHKVFLIDPALIPYFKDLLESDKILHVGHNLIYDFKWLLVKFGIHMQRMFCSMLAEQMLTAGLLGLRVGLADSVRRRAPHWIINKAIRDKFVHLGHTEGCPDCEPGLDKKLTREMGYYGGRDIVLLPTLMREQLAEIKHWKLEKVAQVEFDIIPAVAEMELGGIELHMPTMRQIIEYWTQREEELVDEFFKLYSEERKKAGKGGTSLIPGLDAVVNLKSNAAKLEALKELDIDLDNIQRNTLKLASKGVVERQKGRKKVEEKLDITESQRRLLLIFAEISNVYKMVTTYGKNMVEKISPVTGKWHPRFKQLGSGEEENRRSGSEDKSTIATGRFSSDAQQFPKPKDLFAPVKNPKETEQVMATFAAEIAALKVNEVEQAAA